MEFLVKTETSVKARDLSKHLYKLGIRWASMHPFTPNSNRWDRFREDTCYVICDRGVRYGSSKPSDKTRFKVIPLELVLSVSSYKELCLKAMQ